MSMSERFPIDGRENRPELIEILEHTAPDGKPCFGTKARIANLGSTQKPKLTLSCTTCHRSGVIAAKA